MAACLSKRSRSGGGAPASKQMRKQMGRKVVVVVVAAASAFLAGMMLYFSIYHHTIYSAISDRQSSSHLWRWAAGNERKKSIPPVDFSIRPRFTFPHPQATKQMDEVLSADWVKQLQDHLSTRSSRTIVMVEISENFLDVLLNWLVAVQLHTQLSPHEVIILSMDETVHKFLIHRKLTSFFLPKETVLRSEVKLHSPFSHIWLLRMVVARLLNHWGFDVAMLDVDAIPLKDPLQLFAEYASSDIVGQQGKYPFDLHQQWGVTLCMGVVLLRSTPATEHLWKAVSLVKTNTFDDQVKINYALNAVNVRWFVDHRCPSVSRCTVYGASSTGLNVTLLSQDAICRSCSLIMRDSYTVWHQQVTRESSLKERKARKGGVWFLRFDWREISDSRRDMTGAEWLRAITIQEK